MKIFKHKTEDIFIFDLGRFYHLFDLHNKHSYEYLYSRKMNISVFNSNIKLNYNKLKNYNDLVKNSEIVYPKLEKWINSLSELRYYDLRNYGNKKNILSKNCIEDIQNPKEKTKIRPKKRKDTKGKRNRKSLSSK